MGFPKEVYEILQKIVGKSFVSKDPVTCEAYVSTGHGKDLGIERLMYKKASCVVLPRTTREIQEIVRTANRYDIPYTPGSTFWAIWSQTKQPNALIIDLKRMNELSIDEKNMYAIAESGVIYSQLQEEAMKRGLYITVPGGGGQVSVIANMITAGWSPLNYRIGMPSRRILGTEWVLPDGEVLELGSLATGRNPFWGEGPGPDLRFILRGYSGWFGGLGIVTKMAVKLFPFQPERLKPSGVSPTTSLELPTSRMRWFNYFMPNQEALVEAMYEIGRAGIGAAVMKVPVMWRYVASSNSREEFWERWSKELEKLRVSYPQILRILLIGYTSEEQLEYESRVLNDIMVEHGGESHRTRQSDESWIKNADSASMWAVTGGYASCSAMIDTVDSAVKGGRHYAEIKRKFTPPLVDDLGEAGWFQLGEYGHMGYLEFLNYWDPNDIASRERLDQWYFDEIPKADARLGMYNLFQCQMIPVYSTKKFGPNHHLWIERVKKLFDPKELSNPPCPFEFDEMVRRADHLKGDWD
jgi:FAD/FMN-containing dehydrogenase